MSWIIAAFVLPIPLAHVWLHALLPWWKKHPWAVYVCGILLWIGSGWFTWTIQMFSPVVFVPLRILGYLGWAMVAIGFLAAVWSLKTLGVKRFLVWAVLRPERFPSHERTARGPFRWFPHPAYVGYLVAALGNFLADGRLYLLGVFAVVLILTPVMIWFEEHELRSRGVDLPSPPLRP